MRSSSAALTIPVSILEKDVRRGLLRPTAGAKGGIFSRKIRTAKCHWHRGSGPVLGALQT